MILTQELWEEYTAAFPDDFSWEELMDAGLTAQACAAANATNWKLERVQKELQRVSLERNILADNLEYWQRGKKTPDECDRLHHKNKVLKKAMLILAKDDWEVVAAAISKATGGE